MNSRSNRGEEYTHNTHPKEVRGEHASTGWGRRAMPDPRVIWRLIDVNVGGGNKTNTFYVVAQMKLVAIYRVKFNGSIIILCFVGTIISGIK